MLAVSEEASTLSRRIKLRMKAPTGASRPQIERVQAAAPDQEGFPEG
jgi:hypothetical protein